MTDPATGGASGTQRLLGLGLVLLAGVLLHLLGPILTPFLIALALAYLWDPAVDRLERAGLGRAVAVSLVFLVMTLLIVLLVLVLVPLLGRQMHVMAAKVPVVVEWFRATLLPWLQHKFSVGEGDIPLEDIKDALMANWQSAGGIAQRVLSSATTSSLALLGWFANLVLVPVVTFYLLRDWDVMIAKVRAVLPRAWEPTAVALARECDEVVSAFIRGQLLVMLALGFCYTLGLMLVGLDLALLIGVLAGLASIVPYLGLVLGVGRRRGRGTGAVRRLGAAGLGRAGVRAEPDAGRHVPHAEAGRRSHRPAPGGGDLRGDGRRAAVRLHRRAAGAAGVGGDHGAAAPRARALPRQQLLRACRGSTARRGRRARGAEPLPADRG